MNSSRRRRSARSPVELPPHVEAERERRDRPREHAAAERAREPSDLSVATGSAPDSPRLIVWVSRIVAPRSNANRSPCRRHRVELKRCTSWCCRPARAARAPRQREPATCVVAAHRHATGRGSRRRSRRRSSPARVRRVAGRHADQRRGVRRAVAVAPSNTSSRLSGKPAGLRPIALAPVAAPRIASPTAISRGPSRSSRVSGWACALPSRQVTRTRRATANA